MAIGARAGDLWSIGLVGGKLYGLGPVLAAGAFAPIFENPPGAAIATTLEAMGVSDPDIAFLKEKLMSGRTVVVVHGTSSYEEAIDILDSQGALSILIAETGASPQHSHELAAS
jgi:hypothetical protein